MNNYTSIFDYIQRQETAYKLPINLNEAWSWGMKDHLLTSELYNNSQLKSGKTDFTPVKNITRPILNLQHRTEDIEVKDVQIYVDDSERYFLSFLVKKYHDDVFAVENDLDTFFDELNVSRIDYGGGLSKMLNKPCPEVVPLQTIAFCDQTDMLSGPIGIKHFYSPDQLLDMESKGWGDPKNGATIAIPELIALSKEEKVNDNNEKIQTPGRYIEVYEVHGNLPKMFSDPTDDSGRYQTSLFIVAFYQKADSSGKQGVILYTAPEKKSPFKLIKRDPVYGRALGFGGAEELFESQVWVNYDMIRMQDMLDSAAKTILKYTGPGMTNRTRIRDMDNNEIIELGIDEDLSQVDTYPRNLKLFENSIATWESHAKEIGAAQDPLQGAEPTAGTPFASLQAQIQQGMGLHEYRKGIYAKHLEEIYKDWIIPHIEKKICEGSKFLSELTLEQLQYVANSLVDCQTNYFVKEKILNGELVADTEVEAYKQKIRDDFKKKGNKHFIEILKGEFSGAKLSVKVSIAGKSKNLGKMADNMTNIFRQIFANPQQFVATMQIPAAATAFNDLLEYSGISPMDFNDFSGPMAAQPQDPGAPVASPGQQQMPTA